MIAQFQLAIWSSALFLMVTSLTDELVWYSYIALLKRAHSDNVLKKAGGGRLVANEGSRGEKA